VIEPYIRFAGQVGEQATMFFRDPSGNALEFKSFRTARSCSPSDPAWCRHATTHFIFIRHGETDWNRQQRFQGQIDVPLNAMGLAQAAAGQRLAGRPGRRCWCASDLTRARQTAAPLARPGAGSRG
jgi:hypothetical protein